ncbi:MAG: hypothetical protein WCV88_04120 [Patescibacteria group bacterium]|jgi:hypothetical protein
MNKPVFGELFLDRAEGRNAIHLYVSQPSPLEDKNLGRIFVLLEFDSVETYTETIVQAIDEMFTSAYYRASDFEIEAAFERALQKVNTAIQDQINQHGEGWTYHCHGIVGVLHGTTAYFSTVGKIDGYLIQGDEIIDIVQYSPTNTIQPLKLFNTLVSGKCPERGGLLFCTNNLLNYLSLEKLRRTVLDHTSADGVEYLNTVLSDQDTLTNIAALLIKFEDVQNDISDETIESLTKIDITTTEADRDKETNDSMSKLIDQERTTGDLLTPSIWPTIKKRLQYVGNQSAGKTEQRRAVEDNYAKSQNAFVNVLLIIWQFIVNVAHQIMLGLVWLFKISVQLGQMLFKRSNSMSRSVGRSRWNISLPQKIFAGLLVLTLLVILISLFIKSRSNNNSQQTDTQAASLQEIDQFISEAESKQLVKDEVGARAALAQAEALISTVSADKLGDRSTKINNLDTALNKVTVLDSPTLVGDLSDKVGDAQNLKLSLIGKNVFVFSGSSTGVWRVNIDKQEVTSVIESGTDTTGFKSVENDTAATTLAVVNDKDFVQFNPVLEKTSAVTVGLKDDQVAITDIDIFADRLYVMAADQNRIVKLTKSGNSYATPTNWLSDSESLQDAISFDIDSSIYILFSDGNVKQYDGGTSSNFKLPEFSPSLAGSVKLVKNNADDPFIILNPSTQRVVVLSADGKLQAQYKSPAFSNAKDVAYDAANKIIYVVSDNKVYSVGL